MSGCRIIADSGLFEADLWCCWSADLWCCMKAVRHTRLTQYWVWPLEITMVIYWSFGWRFAPVYAWIHVSRYGVAAAALRRARRSRRGQWWSTASPWHTTTGSLLRTQVIPRPREPCGAPCLAVADRRGDRRSVLLHFVWNKLCTFRYQCIGRLVWVAVHHEWAIVSDSASRSRS
jgi:hypothetical protein